MVDLFSNIGSKGCVREREKDIDQKAEQEFKASGQMFDPVS